ncbi:ATP-binding protein [Mesoplasma seiffertii]|uniref:ATP-binding protein n=1 Tax=Mesoplasma seiffertii TaxID=28224 RepID=UPI00056874C3|nr:ATP-binding protein [Mesoplasma seiffertii]
MNNQLAVFKKNAVIQELISSHQISDEILSLNEPILDDFVNTYIQCEPGPLKKCRQATKGYTKTLEFTNGRFYIKLKKCAHWLTENKNYEMKQHFIYLDYDLDGFDFTIPEYLLDVEKNAELFTKDEIEKRKIFLKDALTRLQKGYSKGVYLYGEPGIGKTTLIKVLANHAAFKNYSVAFANVGNLINSEKNSWSETNKKAKNNQFIAKFKKTDVLFLDDIGGESVSNWWRDDFLFTILNYRMEHKKITFFTSNFSMEELKENYVIKSDNSAIEKIKQNRFMERIRTLAVSFELKGKNHRK